MFWGTVLGGFKKLVRGATHSAEDAVLTASSGRQCQGFWVGFQGGFRRWCIAVVPATEPGLGTITFVVPEEMFLGARGLASTHSNTALYNVCR